MRIYFQNICSDYEARKQFRFWSYDPEITLEEWKYSNSAEMLSFVKWEKRVEVIYEHILFQEPDIICLIECQKCMQEMILQKLGENFEVKFSKGYPYKQEWFEQRDFDGEVYHSIFYNKTMYDYVDESLFYVFEKVVVFMVKLREIKTGKLFWVMAHHYQAYSSPEKHEVDVILDHINTNMKDDNIIFCGQENLQPLKYNGERNKHIWKYIENGFADTYNMSSSLITYYTIPKTPHKSECKRYAYIFYKGFTLRENIRIHDIISSKLKKELESMQGKELLLKNFGSDHIPLMSELI